MKNTFRRGFATLSLALGAVAVSHAIDFDYETVALGSYANSLTVSNGGVDCTASSAGGWVHVTDMLVPTAMGHRYVIANGSQSNTPPTAPFSAIDFNFSSVVNGATLFAGDTGGDDDGFVTVSLYDASNAFITQYQSFLGTSANAVSINITDSFKRAVVDTTASFNPHSVGAEWRSLNATPEPATLIAFAAPLIGLIRRKRKA